MHIANETVVSHASLPAVCLHPETDTNVPGNGSKCTGWLLCQASRLNQILTSKKFCPRDLVINAKSQFPKLCTACIG